ncbi:MAG: metallophosphoesterase [Eubacteriales bacterium]|nr:metallophosphoesterase [Eubacteriales bacterium]
MARYEYHHRKPPRRRLRLSHVVLVLLALLLVAYPFFEAYHINITKTELVIADLPTNLKSLKIVFLTDIHECARFPQSRVDALVNTVNGLSADLVLLGGDYADEGKDTLAFFQNLPTLHARLGVYGVLGECDREELGTDLAPLAKAMTTAGVLPLINDVAKIKVGQIYLYIAGADDVLTGQPDLSAIAGQVRADDFVIFLGHNPDLLTAALKANGSDGDNHWFDLALFGHTHGGQITLFGLPLLGQLVPTLGNRYVSGWLTENRANILISNGVGTSFFPARLFAPAQIHLITLKKK